MPAWTRSNPEAAVPSSFLSFFWIFLSERDATVTCVMPNGFMYKVYKSA